MKDEGRRRFGEDPIGWAVGWAADSMRTRTGRMSVTRAVIAVALAAAILAILAGAWAANRAELRRVEAAWERATRRTASPIAHASPREAAVVRAPEEPQAAEAPGEPRVPLAEAMREAVERLPGPGEIRAYSRADLREKEIEYRDALAWGEPVVFGGSLRDVTQAFAAELDAERREEWLEACLTEVKGMTEGRRVLGRNWLASRLEAIYNLTATEAVKTEAYLRWNDLETFTHDAEARKGRNDWVGTMPIWEVE